MNKIKQFLILYKVKCRLRKRLAEYDKRGEYEKGTGVDVALRIIQEEIDRCLD